VESRRLTGIEEKITAIVAGRAVLAAVRTFQGVRWFVFYPDSPDWTAELDGRAGRPAAGSEPGHRLAGWSRPDYTGVEIAAPVLAGPARDRVTLIQENSAL
jgi:hypothetical protein